MDIRNNLSTTSHFSPYTSSAYPAAGTGTVEGDTTAVLAPNEVRFPSGGDSLMPMSYDAYSYRSQSKEISIEKRLLRWRFVYVVSGTTCAVSTVVFVILVTEPLLVIFFTLGHCVSGNCEEWLEFSYDVLSFSLIPLVLVIIAGTVTGVAYVVRRRLMRKIA